MDGGVGVAEVVDDAEVEVVEVAVGGGVEGGDEEAAVQVDGVCKIIRGMVCILWRGEIDLTGYS